MSDQSLGAPPQKRTDRSISAVTATVFLFCVLECKFLIDCIHLRALGIEVFAAIWPYQLVLCAFAFFYICGLRVWWKVQRQPGVGADASRAFRFVTVGVMFLVLAIIFHDRIDAAFRMPMK